MSCSILRQLAKAPAPIDSSPSGNSKVPIRRQFPAKAFLPIDTRPFGNFNSQEKSHPANVLSPTEVKFLGRFNSPFSGTLLKAP